jgi:TPR repeat protein
MFKYVLCLLLFVLGVNSNAALHRHCSTVNGEYVCAYLDEKEIDALNKISKRKNSNYSNATQNSKDYTSSDAKSSIVYSCNLGNSVNCFSLGWNYENGVNGYTKDYSKAIEFYRKSCNLNNGRGCNNLGDLYYNGNGVDKDYDVAFYLFEKACKLNSEYGCFSLGKMYADGKGTLQDYQKAKSHYNKSCQLGYKVACNINLNNNSSDSNISNKDQSSQRQHGHQFPDLQGTRSSYGNQMRLSASDS